MSGQSLPCDRAVEHPADSDPIEIGRRDAEANDSAGVYVHHHHYPIAPEQNRLSAEEIDAPQAILRTPDGGEPRQAITTWRRSVIPYENAPDDILIKVDAECAGDLLGDLAAVKVRIAPLHLYNSIYQFFCWTLGPRATSSFCAVKKLILSLDQSSVKARRSVEVLTTHGQRPPSVWAILTVYKIPESVDPMPSDSDPGAENASR